MVIRRQEVPGVHATSGSAPDRSGEEDRPSELRAIPESRVVLVDVREDLRVGREPFSRIMAARQDMLPGGALCIRAIFEPVPLYAVMLRHGLIHHTERLGEEDWKVWFYEPGTPDPGGSGETGSPPGVPAHEAPDEPSSGHVHVLDVRGLEPPEPMVKTLEALEALPRGHTLVHLNVRVPRFLLPRLDERGFVYDVREQSPEHVRVLIRRAP